jgi:gliding motility-associated-like protein
MIYNNIITVLARPQVQFVTDPEVITMSDPNNVIIKNATVGGKTFTWSALGEDLGNNSAIIYSFSDTGCVAFKLISENDLGCIDSLEKNVCVIDGFNFWIPASFTPNNDGINDVFFPIGTGFVADEYLFEVYNRWGNRIFRTKDVNGSWDGKTKGGTDEVGQYLWYITVKDNRGVVHHQKGFVDVMR